MPYNYNKVSYPGVDAPTFQAWNTILNSEDMDHDSSSSAKSSALYKECKSSLFPSGPPKGEAEMLYTKPEIIPKIIDYKPNVITEQYSIRDTEPASKLHMEEKYTPAYYFDPASRSFPKKFVKTVTAFHGETIPLRKYGIDGILKITFCNKDLIENRDGDFMKMQITYNYTSNGKILQDMFPVYIKEGYIYEETIKKTTKQKTLTGATIATAYVGGNSVKDKFFSSFLTSKYSTEHTMRGRRLILCKLLGDLLHCVCATDEDLVFTIDSYLRDRCRKCGVAVVQKEKHFIDALYNKKKEKWDVLIDILYEKYKSSYFPIVGGVGSSKSKKIVATKVKKTKALFTRKELQGRENEISILKNRKTGIKYSKINCSLYSYFPKGPIYSGGGTDVKSHDQTSYILPKTVGGETHTLETITTIGGFLQKINADATHFRLAQQEKRKQVATESGYGDNPSPTVYQHFATVYEDNILDIIPLINKIIKTNLPEHEIAMSDDFSNLIDFIIKDSYYNENAIEKMLINIFKNEQRNNSEELQTFIDTHFPGKIIYDYRILNDILVDFDTINLTFANVDNNASIVTTSTDIDPIDTRMTYTPMPMKTGAGRKKCNRTKKTKTGANKRKHKFTKKTRK